MNKTSYQLLYEARNNLDLKIRHKDWADGDYISWCHTTNGWAFNDEEEIELSEVDVEEVDNWVVLDETKISMGINYKEIIINLKASNSRLYEENKGLKQEIGRMAISNRKFQMNVSRFKTDYDAWLKEND